jgi:dTDP-4-dehydrorhamnose reductase
MLGHKLWQVFEKSFDTWVTIRSNYSQYSHYGIFDPKRTIENMDIREVNSTARVIESVRPDVVINAIGIIKQIPEASDPIVSLTANSIFPHHLAKQCQQASARLIHISTDCVFSGLKGQYTEDDVPDTDDLYGRSKLLGEVNSSHCLTLRTSVIGRELHTSNGLVEWFLSQAGETVQGYKKAIYTGFPTVTLARIIVSLIQEHPNLSGLYHVSSEPITKYNLLRLMGKFFGVSVKIQSYSGVSIDRSLISNRFRSATGFIPQPWPEMVDDMASDPTSYNEWRSTNDS